MPQPKLYTVKLTRTVTQEMKVVFAARTSKPTPEKAETEVLKMPKVQSDAGWSTVGSSPPIVAETVESGVLDPTTGRAEVYENDVA